MLTGVRNGKLTTMQSTVTAVNIVSSLKEQKASLVSQLGTSNTECPEKGTGLDTERKKAYV